MAQKLINVLCFIGLIFGIVVSTFFSSVSAHYFLPDFLDNYKIIAAGSIGALFSIALCANQFSPTPSFLRSIVFSSTTLLGSAMVCYSELDNSEDKLKLKKLDMQNYEAIVNTTEDNAKKHVLKSQRESVKEFRKNILSHKTNNASFFQYISDTFALDSKLIHIIFSGLVGLCIEVSLVTLILSLKVRSLTVVKLLTESVRSYLHRKLAGKKMSGRMSGRMSGGRKLSAPGALTKLDLVPDADLQTKYRQLTSENKRKMLKKLCKTMSQAKAGEMVGVTRQTVNQMIKKRRK